MMDSLHIDGAISMSVLLVVASMTITFLSFCLNRNGKQKQPDDHVIKELAWSVLCRIKSQSKCDPPIVLGINGCCGAGKSTLASKLKSYIERMRTDETLNIIRINFQNT
jgi:pantothenate kinase-related protein Tda10